MRVRRGIPPIAARLRIRRPTGLEHFAPKKRHTNDGRPSELQPPLHSIGEKTRRIQVRTETLPFIIQQVSHYVRFERWELADGIVSCGHDRNRHL